jgi:hypothetical protein
MAEVERAPTEPSSSFATRLSESAVRAGLEAIGIFFVGWAAYAIRLWVGWNRLRPIGELLRDGPAWAMALMAAGVWFFWCVILGALGARKPEASVRQGSAERPVSPRPNHRHRRR